MHHAYGGKALNMLPSHGRTRPRALWGSAWLDGDRQSDPPPATQRSAFIVRPNPSLAPPPTTTAPPSTALSLCAAAGRVPVLARTPSARCAQWRVPQIRAGRPTMRRAAVQHAVQAVRRCGRAFRAYTCEPLAAGGRIIKYTLRRMTANGGVDQDHANHIAEPAAAPCRLHGVLHGGAAHRWEPGANLGTRYCAQRASSAFAKDGFGRTIGGSLGGRRRN